MRLEGTRVYNLKSLLICLVLLTGGVSITSVSYSYELDSSSSTISTSTLESFNSFESETIEQSMPREPVGKAALASTEEFTWENCFDFTNSETYFSDVQMTREDVAENLANYIMQLYYSDIEIACELSIFDISLLMGLDAWILEMLEVEFGGFCGGMSQAARDWFLEPDNIPLGYDRSWDLPAPNPDPEINRETAGSVTESMIKQYMYWKGTAAFFNPNHLMNSIRIYLASSLHSGGTNNHLEFLRVQDLMLKGTSWYEPVVILLAFPWWDNTSIGQMHFVVAYDYDSDLRRLYIYDVNNHYNESHPLRSASYEAFDDDGDPNHNYIQFDENWEFEGTRNDTDAPWTRICAYEPNIEYSSILTTFAYFVEQFSAIIVGSPVDVHVTDIDGKSIGPNLEGSVELEFPAIYTSSNEKTNILLPYTGGAPLQIIVTGTDVGDYTLEIERVINGEFVIASVHRDTLPGQVDTFILTMDDDGISLKRQGVELSEPDVLGSSSISLSWTQYHVDDFSKYEVYQSMSLGNLGSHVGTILDPETTHYTIHSLQPQTRYYFTIRVVDRKGEFADSNQVLVHMYEEPATPDYTAPIVSVSVIGAVALFTINRKRRT
ncbi:MAG: fibronectin type III domain-containing protein [Candidatus Thorarchaeota archaeon]